MFYIGLFLKMKWKLKEVQMKSQVMCNICPQIATVQDTKIGKEADKQHIKFQSIIDRIQSIQRITWGWKKNQWKRETDLKGWNPRKINTVLTNLCAKNWIWVKTYQKVLRLTPWSQFLWNFFIRINSFKFASYITDAASNH